METNRVVTVGSWIGFDAEYGVYKPSKPYNPMSMNLSPDSVARTPNSATLSTVTLNDRQHPQPQNA